jgi:hypothetical protein
VEKMSPRPYFKEGFLGDREVTVIGAVKVVDDTVLAQVGSARRMWASCG